MTAFCDSALYSLVEVATFQRLAMMEAVHTFETLVCFNDKHGAISQKAVIMLAALRI
jgi:hypothetical protein